MILPVVRASFGRRHAQHLVHLLGADDTDLLEAAQRRLEEDGLDAILDDPRTRNALLTDPRAAAPPDLMAYVLVRQALLEGGVDDRPVADYVTSLMLRFGEGRQAYRLGDQSDEEFHHLVDIVLRMDQAGSRDRFILNSHLGNFSLWISGIFPQFVEARRQRRGAPPLDYYEKMGAGGFRQAAESREAAKLGLEPVLQFVSAHFRGVRIALNRISDRVFWPSGGNPVNRLLRELEQSVS